MQSWGISFMPATIPAFNVAVQIFLRANFAHKRSHSIILYALRRRQSSHFRAQKGHTPSAIWQARLRESLLGWVSDRKTIGHPEQPKPVN
jgi:hypothetical protein